MRIRISLNTFRIILLITGSVFFAMLCFVAFSRMAYPYALEWVEGGILIHLQRVLQGEPIYTAATADWVPYTYTPLYYYVSAAVSKITGFGFFPLRLVSFVSTLLTMFVITGFVKKETGSFYIGVVSALLYSATYEVVAQWFDVGRIDALFLLFLLSGTYFLRFGKSAVSAITAAILFVLALFTKQSALIPIIPLLVYLIICRKGMNRFLIPITFTLLTVSILLIAENMTGGNFLWRTFFMTGRISFAPKPHISFWVKYIFGYFPIASTLSIYLLLTLYRNKEKDNLLFYLLFLTGFLGVSLLSSVKLGAWSSVMMPAYAALVIAFGSGLKEILPAVTDRKKSKALLLFEGKETGNSPLLPFVIMFMVIFQFFVLNYKPGNAIPTQEDREAGDRIVKLIRETQGNVYIPEHNYLALLAGKKTYANGIALIALSRTGHADLVESIKADINEKIISGEISTVITVAKLDTTSADNRLQLVDELFDSPNIFNTITGLPNRPNYVYISKAGQ